MTTMKRNYFVYFDITYLLFLNCNLKLEANTNGLAFLGRSSFCQHMHHLKSLWIAYFVGAPEHRANVQSHILILGMARQNSGDIHIHV